MGVLTKEQLDVIWNDHGLKFRLGRFQAWLVERGLKAFITKDKIQRHFYEVLEAFLVKDVRETEDGRQTTPP